MCSSCDRTFGRWVRHKGRELLEHLSQRSVNPEANFNASIFVSYWRKRFLQFYKDALPKLSSRKLPKLSPNHGAYLVSRSQPPVRRVILPGDILESSLMITLAVLFFPGQNSDLFNHYNDYIYLKSWQDVIDY